MVISKRFKVLLSVVILFILFDRTEFIYYMEPHPERLFGFWIKGEPIRADAYWYFASIRVQYMIFAAIIYLLIPELRRSLGVYFWITFLYFLEYFATYNEPITRVNITGWFGIPISVTLLKYLGFGYIFFEWIKKVFLTDYGRL